MWLEAQRETLPPSEATGLAISLLDPSDMLTPLSVVIPTRNEERNLHRTLLSVLGWADEVVVFDSMSEDRTLEIAHNLGIRSVQRNFDNFSEHKNWAIDNLQLRNEWILFLDADERPTAALRSEISGRLQAPSRPYVGYYIARKNYFMGEWIKHAGMFPDWNLRLFKRHLGRYENRLVHEHLLLKGPVGYLSNPLEHDDYKGLARWLERHNLYTSMEAIEINMLLTGGRKRDTVIPNGAARGPQRRRLMKELAYRYVPWRPLFTFTWMYLIRAGFLDGRIGFRYCLLKSVADYLTDLKLLEMRATRTTENQAGAVGKSTSVKSSGLDTATDSSSSCQVTR